MVETKLPVLINVFIDNKINDAHDIGGFVKSVRRNPIARKAHFFTDFGRVTLLYNGEFDNDILRSQYEKLVKFKTWKWVQEEE